MRLPCLAHFRPGVRVPGRPGAPSQLIVLTLAPGRLVAPAAWTALVGDGDDNAGIGRELSARSTAAGGGYSYGQSTPASSRPPITASALVAGLWDGRSWCMGSWGRNLSTRHATPRRGRTPPTAMFAQLASGAKLMEWGDELHVWGDQPRGLGHQLGRLAILGGDFRAIVLGPGLTRGHKRRRCVRRRRGCHGCRVCGLVDSISASCHRRGSEPPVVRQNSSIPL